MVDRISCPVCGQLDKTARVSTLYVLGLERKLHKSGWRSRRSGKHDLAPDGGQENAYPLPRLAQNLATDELVILSQRLAPPSAPKPPALRVLHPDFVVLTFSLISPVFFYGIYNSQRSWLLPLALVLGLAYGLYFWQRRTLLARYDVRVAKDLTANEQIRRALERWMGLYYCGRDDVVFDPMLNLSEDADGILDFVKRD